MQHHLNRENVDKPWGNYKRFTLNYPSTVKIITVNPHQKLSLQSHKRRDEFWRVLDGGMALATTNDEVREVGPGDEVFIPIGTTHRLEALDQTVVFLEISFGEFDEEDIERIDDDYGRT